MGILCDQLLLNLLESPDNILYDQTIRLKGPQTRKKYPVLLRRIGFYSAEHKRPFTYLTNNIGISAKYIAQLYKNRWQEGLSFKWIKQHLHLKSLIRELFERLEPVDDIPENGHAQLYFNF
jgi:hypothetical protein